MATTFVSASSLQAKNGLPLASQVFGWIVFCTHHPYIVGLCAHGCLAIAILPPFFTPRKVSVDTKIFVYYLALCPCFVILSIRAEGLFYISYCATLWLWVQTEAAIRDALARQEQTHGNAQQDEDNAPDWNVGKLRLDDVRISLFFLFFVQVGFFGTGKWVSYVTAHLLKYIDY